MELLPWPAGACWRDVLDLLQPIWNFLRLEEPLVPADALIVCGSNDLTTARYAAELYHRELAPRVVCTGGIAHVSDLLATGWQRPEAEVFAVAMTALGVPVKALLLEPAARNSAENFRLARRVLEAAGVVVGRALIVHKPFMERRALLTAAAEWPDVTFAVTSLPCSLEQYLLFNRDPVATIHIILGDLQRLQVYGEQGWHAPQPMPAAIAENFRRLVELGFDRHLLKGTPRR